jgi:hypothetical protein
MGQPMRLQQEPMELCKQTLPQAIVAVRKKEPEPRRNTNVKIEMVEDASPANTFSLLHPSTRSVGVDIGDCWSANSVTAGGQITEDDLA